MFNKWPLSLHTSRPRRTCVPSQGLSSACLPAQWSRATRHLLEDNFIPLHPLLLGMEELPPNVFLQDLWAFFFFFFKGKSTKNFFFFLFFKALSYTLASTTCLL